MGDRGEPCGVPSGTVNESMSVESKRMEAVRLVRNEKTHCTIFEGNPFFFRISRALLASMWSKNPEMSKRMRAAWWPDLLVAWILWTRVRAASVVQCCGLDPNWLLGSMLGYRAMSLLIRLVITFSRSLPVHSMRLTGDIGLAQPGLPGGTFGASLQGPGKEVAEGPASCRTGLAGITCVSTA